jgi:hypothetical protein
LDHGVAPLDVAGDAQNPSIETTAGYLAKLNDAEQLAERTSIEVSVQAGDRFRPRTGWL